MEPQNTFGQEQKLFQDATAGLNLDTAFKYRKNPIYTIVLEFQVQTLHINLSLN